MKNLWPRVLVLGLLTEFALSCGETVNYDTQEKIANTLVVPDTTGGGGDAVANDPAAADDGTTNSDATTDGDGLPAACSTRPMQTKQEALVFPEIAPGTTCSFGSGENLSKRNGYFRAYLRQTQIVSLPEGAILCGISLEHQPAAMRYDDEMFFSVNNKLLLATKDYSEYFPKTDFFRSFSWANLKNKVYDPLDDRNVFCAGAEEGISDCKVPPTETQGNIEMKFSDEMNKILSQALQADNKLTFEWITTGDDDNSDCRHSEIDLSLGLRYVMP